MSELTSETYKVDLCGLIELLLGILAGRGVYKPQTQSPYQLEIGEIEEYLVRECSRAPD